MPIIDTGTPPEKTESAAEAAYQIRMIFARSGQQIQQKLGRVVSIVQKHGRQAIAAELGADAAELLAIHQKAKELAELIDASYSAPELP